MADSTHLEERLLRTLDRLREHGILDSYYLAGGTALTFYFSHRHSYDLDFFVLDSSRSLGQTKFALLGNLENVSIQAETDVALHTLIDGVPVDFIAYPFPLLDPPLQNESGLNIARLRDLATMKLVAVARRGLRRDFWDLYALAQNGVSLKEMCDAYVLRFGVSEADLYHVIRALTYFEDAEKDDILPRGMTESLWIDIKAYFETEAPRLVSATAGSG